MSGLSPDQIRYLHDVLGVKCILVEGGLRARSAPCPIPTAELSCRGQGHRLIALLTWSRSQGSFPDDERELADKMIQAMKMAPERDVLFLDWPIEYSGQVETEIANKIKSTSAKVVLVFGTAIARALKILSPAGEWNSWHGRDVMVTLSPDELLRNPERKKTAWAHLQLVMQKLV